MTSSQAAKLVRDVQRSLGGDHAQTEHVFGPCPVCHMHVCLTHHNAEHISAAAAARRRG